MSRPKPEPGMEGKRISVWIPPAQLKMAKEIENFSKFVQIAVDQAIDIMAWAMLKEYDPKKYHINHDDDKVLSEFNQKYPLDPLTAKRMKKWRKNSPKPPELW